MAEFEVEVIFHVSNATNADDAYQQVHDALSRVYSQESDPSWEMLEDAATELIVQSLAKVVPDTAQFDFTYDDAHPDGWHVWDADGEHVNGPWPTEEDAEIHRDTDEGEWVGQVIDGVRDESYWTES